MLRRLTLELSPGTVYGLMGRNGAGKSTLLQTLMGLLVPDEGRAHVLDADLSNESLAQKQQVGYVAQGDILPEWMKLRDLLTFEAGLRPSWSGERIDTWLAQEQLLPSRRLGSLSQGQRKRLELELSLAARPQVLILDEPFANLDPVSRAEATEGLLAHAVEHQATVLIASHVLTDLERAGDRLGVLAGGRIALEITLEKLKMGAAVVRVPPDVRDLTTLSPVCRRSVPTGEVWVFTALSPDEEHMLIQCGASVQRPGLEELGIELVRGLS